MKQNQMVAALNQENRMLRTRLAEIERERLQGQFLEELTCAALTGYCTRTDLTVEETAEHAYKAAEAVLDKIVGEVRKAEQAAAAEQEKQAEENPPAEKSRLILD